MTSARIKCWENYWLYHNTVTSLLFNHSILIASPLLYIYTFLRRQNKISDRNWSFTQIKKNIIFFFFFFFFVRIASSGNIDYPHRITWTAQYWRNLRRDLQQYIYLSLSVTRKAVNEHDHFKWSGKGCSMTVFKGSFSWNWHAHVMRIHLLVESLNLMLSVHIREIVWG